MADKKISDLPAAGAVADTDLYPTSQAGTTGKGTIAQLVTRLKVALLNIVPVWTGNPWRWNGAEIRHLYGETGVAADTGLWEKNIDAGVYTLRTRTDADAAGKIAMSVQRSAADIVEMHFGDVTANLFNFFFDAAASRGVMNAQYYTPTGASGRYGMGSSAFREVDIYTEFTSRFHIDILGGITMGNAGANTVISSDNTNVGGQLQVTALGKGLSIAEGSNAKMGTAVLVGGTKVVNTTAVTANSRIILTGQNLGTVAVPSGYAVSARTAGTSFTILASAPTDTSTIAWMIVEPF